MKHLSEGIKKLSIISACDKLINSNVKSSDVSLVILDYYKNVQEFEKTKLYNDINLLINNAEENSVVCILTSPVVAADICSSMKINEYYKLWISIKLKNRIINETYIDQDHCSLIIFAKNKGILKLAKVRIPYSFCPSCDKTTKDYGGKKHIYHHFGTSMSDVWRDISVDFNSYPTDVIDRVECMFRMDQYERLLVYDKRGEYKVINSGQFKYKMFEGGQTNEISSSKLINGDCIDILKTIPDNSVDFCFADPPYNLKKKYNNWNDSLDIKDYFEWCDKWLFELARILKPGRTLAVINIPKWCIRYFKYLNSILDFQDWIVWEGLSAPTNTIIPVHYSILCFSKGLPRELPGKRTFEDVRNNYRFLTPMQGYCLRPSCLKNRKLLAINDKEPISNIWWDIHRLMQNSLRVDHPCQLPPNLMNRLIALFTYENEIVVDPFNGAGTTTLCSSMLNRKYIGVELSEEYHDNASHRHNEVLTGLDPFRKKKNTLPKSKNNNIRRVKRKQNVVTKKALQLEVKDIAQKLGRLPTKPEIFLNSIYSEQEFNSIFVKWSEIYAAAKTTGMSEYREIPI